jgi:hypothetical protein
MAEIIYTPPLLGLLRGDVACHRLEADDITGQLASNVLELIGTAYTRQFEDLNSFGPYKHPLTGRSIPRGTIRRAYDFQDDQRVAQQTERMQVAIENDSVYSLAYLRSTSKDDLLVGLAKVTHRPQANGETPAAKSGNYAYINDILARSARRNVGSVALHSALSWTEANPNDRVVLDGFVGSRVNQWFQRLGFRPVNEATPRALELGDISLPQQRFALPSGYTIRHIRRVLEQKRSWLAEAQPVE